MRALLSFVGVCLSLHGPAVTWNTRQQDVPDDVAALVSKAGERSDVAAWCRLEFDSRRSGVAVALASAGGGRYLAIDSAGRAFELASFRGSADVSCYTRAQAQQLDATIRRSETIHGQVKPRWNTGVICGFVDATAAKCWQYSPRAQAFVTVGEWST